MDWVTVTLVSLTLLGYAATAGGLFRAVLHARHEYRDSQHRIPLMRQLRLEESREQELILSDEGTDSAARSAALHEKYDALYQHHGLVRPSNGNVEYLAFFESRRLLGAIARATRGDVLVALVGLTLSTIGSVWSLLI